MAATHDMSEDPDLDPAPRYQNIDVRLTGSDGNAFMVLGKVGGAMRRAGVPNAEIERFHTEATSGDYDHLLRTCMAWVNVS